MYIEVQHMAKYYGLIVRSADLRREHLPAGVQRRSAGQLYGGPGDLFFAVRGSEQIQRHHERTGVDHVSRNARKKEKEMTGDDLYEEN